jgi:hypothetical protein
MMDIRALQAAINARGRVPPLVADGIAGGKTMAAVDELLSIAPRVVGRNVPPLTWAEKLFGDKRVPSGPVTWSDARKLVAAEQALLNGLQIDAGNVDGLVSEQTRHAREVWDARMANSGKPVPAVEDFRKPDPAPVAAGSTRWPRQRDVEAFYGAKGAHQKMLELPFPMRLAWEPTTLVHRFSCHEKVHDAMRAIWKGALDHYGHDELKRLRLDMYGGCLNVRKMRGGSNWSMHSWGIAEDIDPDRNQLKFKRAQATLDDPPYEPFWKLVYAQGALSLGRERDYDWMHFQFTRDFS